MAVAAPASDERETQYCWNDIPVYRYPISLKPSRAELRGQVTPRYFERFADWLHGYAPDVVHFHSHTRGVGVEHARLAHSLGARVIHTIHVPGVTCARGTMLRWGTTPCDGEMKPERCAACILRARHIPLPLARLLAKTPQGVSRRADASSFPITSLFTYREYVEARTGRVREYLALADKIVVVSQWLYEAFQRNGVPASKLVLCRHGVSDELIAAGKIARESRQSSATLRVGYIGRFDPIKGVDVLVRAVKQLPRAVPLKLVLYGRAQTSAHHAYLDKLKALAVGDARIQFGGEVTSANWSEVMRGLDLLAVPSLCLETGPLVVLEAFAAGLPVVGSRLGGIAELVTDGVNGLLVAAGYTAAWTHALQTLACRVGRVELLAQNVPPVRRANTVLDQMMSLYAN